MKERMDAYASRLIEELQECPGTWRKPWASLGGHRNHFTGRHYHGGNVFRCMLHNMVYGTSSILWVGLGAVKKMGLKVRKGSKACPITVPKTVEDRETGEPKVFFGSAYVLNLDSIEDLEVPVIPADKTLDLDGNCSRLERDILALGSDLHWDAGARCPSYSPGMDRIVMPLRDQFHGQEEYCSTLVHEHVHWTGHESRCNRNLKCGKSSSEYAFEELVAEIGASFMCQLPEYAIPDEKLQHKEYISGWIRLLKDKPRAIFSAAEQAQKAVHHLKSKGGNE